MYIVCARELLRLAVCFPEDARFFEPELPREDAEDLPDAALLLRWAVFFAEEFFEAVLFFLVVEFLLLDAI